MKRILLAAGGLLVAAGGLFVFRIYLSYCGSDWVRTEFATLDDAKAAKAFDRGWLPPLLPEGTTKIVEVNDVESNNGQGSFNAPPESVLAYIEVLKLKYGSLVTTNKAGIRIQIMTDNTRWTVDMDQLTGRGRYAVGLKR